MFCAPVTIAFRTLKHVPIISVSLHVLTYPTSAMELHPTFKTRLLLRMINADVFPHRLKILEMFPAVVALVCLGVHQFVTLQFVWEEKPLIALVAGVRQKPRVVSHVPIQVTTLRKRLTALITLEPELK